MNEIKILNKLNNDNYFPHLYDYNDGDNPFIVMEYLEKSDLFRYIREPHISLNELHAKLIFKKILKCVQYCHNNKICHLDIKLDNILLDKNYKIKLADFGVSKEIPEKGK